MGAAVDAATAPVPEGIGRGAAPVVFGEAVDVLVVGVRDLRTVELAVFSDEGAAVPRYGTVVTGTEFVRITAGVDVARTAPFADSVGIAPSFLGSLAWLFSTGPEAFRLSGGCCEVPFAPPAGRDNGFEAPACATGLIVLGADGSTIDIRSLKALMTSGC